MLITPVIDIQNQILGETARITGTPFRLHYRSDRVRGRKAAYSMKITLSGVVVPARLKGIELEVDVAGRRFTESFSSAPDQSYTFTWDGQDVSGRILQQKQLAKIRIGYVYPASFPRPELIRWQEMTKAVGTCDARIQGLGGWSLSVHHFYDHLGHVLYLGDGEARSSLNIDNATNFQGNHPGNSPTRGEVTIPAVEGNEVYVFDGAGQHLQTVNTLTGALRYRFEYDAAGSLASIQDRDGNVTRIERNAEGAPTAISAPFGQRTVLSTDTDGYLTTITDPTGASIRLNYSNDGLLGSVADPNGHLYRFSYDDQGRVTRCEDPAGGFDELQSTRDLNGFLVALTTALGRESTFLVERLPTGEERHVNRCCGGSEVVTLVGKDGTRTITYPDGVSQTVELQADPRFGAAVPFVKKGVLKTPSGLATTIIAKRTAELADSGNRLGVSVLNMIADLNGRTHTAFFDARPKQITYTTPMGRRIVTTLNAQGRVIQVDVAGLLPIVFVYDENGRMSTVTQGSDANVRGMSISYDSEGCISGITDPLNHTVTYAYNQAGRVTKQTLQDGREIDFTYDASGNGTSVTPPGRDAHFFEYTPVSLVDNYSPPRAFDGGNDTVYTYNKERQLTRLALPSGAIIDLHYDAIGHLNTVSSAGGQMGFAYDPVTTMLMSVTDLDGGILSYNYDGFLLTDTTWKGTVEGSVCRTYDNDLRITAMSVNGGQPIRFQYDEDGLVIEAGALTLKRDLHNGLITGTDLGGLTTSLVYNGFGEITSSRAKFNNREFFSVQYTRDKLGRIAHTAETVDGHASTCTYLYDLAGRLVNVNRKDAWIADYQYDGNGNRLMHRRSNKHFNGSYDAQDRITQYDDTSYGHAAGGERSSKTVAGQTTTYVYDVFSNLKAVSLNDGTRIDYLTDGRHRRTGKKVNGISVQSLLYQDALCPIAELDGQNIVISRFIYASKSNLPDYMEKDGKTYQIVSDHLGSPRTVIDVTTGEIAQRLDYDEFGNVLRDTHPGFQPFGFAGGIYDTHTKLTHFGARDYDAGTGRWMTKDPIGLAGGMNLYCYVGNDPVNRVDSNGLEEGAPSAPQTSNVWGNFKNYYGPKCKRAWDWARGKGEDKIKDRCLIPSAIGCLKSDGRVHGGLDIGSVEINGHEVIGVSAHYDFGAAGGPGSSASSDIVDANYGVDVVTPVGAIQIKGHAGAKIDQSRSGLSGMSDRTASQEIIFNEYLSGD